MKIYLVLFLLLSAFEFLLMRIDKRRAVKKMWRIPESVLLFFAVLGPLGCTAAMCLKLKGGRHKNNKPYFWWITVLGWLLNAAAATVICYLV